APGDVVVELGVARSRPGRTAPARILFVDGIVDGDDRGGQLRTVGGVPPLEHVGVRGGQGFTQEERLRGAVGTGGEAQRVAEAAEHAPDRRQVRGVLVAGAPTPGRLVAILGERAVAAVVVHALRTQAADVVAVGAVELERITRAAQFPGEA